MGFVDLLNSISAIAWQPFTRSWSINPSSPMASGVANAMPDETPESSQDKEAWVRFSQRA
jgi:hypothetical protein